MRVPIKLLGFVVWLFSFNCGQCQECVLGKYENTDPAPKSTFADEEIVRLKCQIGFTGLYKLKCEKGQWKALTERPCAKKKCSHPGDAPNGDFKLLDETEFVFGATVEYKCKKGFEMASRLNRRTCRDGGWDNAVPDCEAVKCPPIHTDGEMTASGNTEEGRYGDVIHFECLSPEKKIKGNVDIHCTEKGDWSHPKPTCEVITCTAPEIPNGIIIDRKPEYNKDETLKYRCLKQFKAREGTPKCASFGWTLKAECDAVTCELKSTTFRVKSIKPEGQTIFRAGESVEITCTDRSWFRSKETKRTFTCQDDGEWDDSPVCEEIKCEVPYNQHVNFPTYYFSGDKSLGAEIRYSCDDGYVNNNNAVKATCNRDGWTPKPLCVEITCAAPDTSIAKIIRGQEQNYKINSRIQYKCHPGFEPQQVQQISCDSQGQWTNIQQCTKMCAAPNIKNAKTEGRLEQYYSRGSKIKYTCGSEFKPQEFVEITCDSQGQWMDMQNCTELCQAPSVENGFSKSYNKDKIFYSCNAGYKPFRGNWWGSVTCSQGSWPDEPLCILEEECGTLPSVQNGKLNLNPRDNRTAELQCDPGFTTKKSSINCISGAWETATCEIGPHCKTPPKVENAVILSEPKTFYIDGSKVTYVCQDLFVIKGEGTVFCRNNVWGEPPTCEVSPHCDIPPVVQNADITSKKEKVYVNGSSVTYACQSPFLLSGENTVFCHNGKWEKTPTCEAKCNKPRENFMKLLKEKESYDNNEVLRYQCIKPYDEIPEGQWICKNGEWSGDFVCKSKTCPPPPYVENGEYTAYRQTADEVITQVYYQCQQGYELSPQQRYYSCVRGKWEKPPKCLKPCEITPEILEKHNINPIQQKVYLTHGMEQLYYCKNNYIVWRRGLAYSSQYLECFDGTLDIKSCQQIPQ